MNKSRKKGPEKCSEKVLLADLPFEPIKVEKFTSTSGERMTRLTFGRGFHVPVDQSVDELFTMAKSHPRVFVGHMFWHSILPWLDSDPDDVATFWKHFNTPTAYARRKQAVEGTISTNRIQERVVVGIARELHGLRSTEKNGPLLLSEFSNQAQRSALHDLGMKQIAEWLLDAVANDHEAPRRLYDVLKSESAAKPSKDGDIFDCFVRFVGRDQRLPTKKRVRQGAKLGNDPEDYKSANKAFRKLGLNGLPEG